MFTNKLPNHDDIGQTFDKMIRISSGRWFLHFPAAISSSYSMPWLNGILSILYISISSALVVKILDIKKSVNCFIIGSIMVTIPIVGSTFSYMNSADPYFFALLLSTLGVFMLTKYKYGWIFSIIFLILGMGTYQAYFGFAAGILVIKLILDILRDDEEFLVKKTIIKSFNYCLTLIVSIIGYVKISKFLANGNLTDYKGIDTMGSIPFKEIPGAILNAYKQFFDFFFRNSYNYHFTFMRYFFFLCLIISIFYAINAIKKRKRSVFELIMIATLFIIFPLAANIIYVMSWKGGVHILMIYGIISTFILIISLFEIENKNDGIKNKALHYIQIISSYVVISTFILAIYNNIYTTNREYFKMHLVYENGYAYTNRLLNRIESIKGYNSDYNIFFVGMPNSKTYLPSPNSVMERDAKMMGIINSIPETWTYRLFPNYYMGFNSSITAIKSSEEFKDFKYKEVTTNMENYPNDNSIVIKDESIIVKFSNIE